MRHAASLHKCGGSVAMAFFWVQVVLPAVLLLLGWGVHRRLRHHPEYDREAVLQRGFSALLLPLPNGEQTRGGEVRVVKRPAPLQKSAYWLSWIDLHQGELAEEFWYCVGPQGACWMLIANGQRHWWRWRVHWVVRPLTVQQLRNALQDDPVALHAAMGAAQGEAAVL